MHYRLGELQCDACPYSEVAAKEPDERPGSAGGGAARREAWQPSSAATVPSAGHKYTGKLLAPPEPGGAPGYPGAPPPPVPGSFGAATWEFGDNDSRSPVLDSLEQEKKIFFAIFCVLELLYVGSIGAMLSIGAAALNTVGGAADPQAANLAAMLPGLVVALVISTAVVIGLVWWVLFGNASCAKWGCLGFVALGVVANVVQLFQSLGGGGPLAQYLPPGSGFGAILVIGYLANLAWQGWFISILYRDIQRAN